MKTVQTIKELISIMDNYQDKSIGFVPTMGYLHEGHQSLLIKARQDNDVVVASIFVNPAQFGPNEDLERYPRDLTHDTVLAKEAGVDILFVTNSRRDVSI